MFIEGIEKHDLVRLEKDDLVPKVCAVTESAGTLPFSSSFLLSSLELSVTKVNEP